MPLPAERLGCLCAVADREPAPFAPRRAQLDVAVLAVRVPAVDRERDRPRAIGVARALELAVAGERQLAELFRRRGGGAVVVGDLGREEWVAALGAEEVLLVIRPLAELGIVQRDKAFVDDRGLAVVAPRSEFLVIVQVTIWLPVMLVAAHILEQIIAHTAPEATWVPA